MNRIRSIRLFIQTFEIKFSNRPLYVPVLMWGMVCTLLCLSNVQAIFKAKNNGNSGAAFLKIGAGARPSALGDAFTGVADDINSIYWNTAGLATLKKKEFIAMRAQLFEDMQYNFFAYAHPTQKLGTFAIGLNNLNVNDLEKRTADTDSADSTFQSNDSAYTLGYAYTLPLQLIGNINLGAGFKYIRQTLDSYTANSLAIDLGSLYTFENSPLAIGFTAQNIGTKAKFKTEGDSLPLTFKLGTSYRLGQDWTFSGIPSENDSVHNGLLLAADFSLPKDNDPEIKMGMELTRSWTENLSGSLRGAGYQVGNNGQISSLGGLGFSAGLGLTYKRFTFDFAWKPFKDLGNTYRYSILLRF